MSEALLEALKSLPVEERVAARIHARHIRERGEPISDWGGCIYFECVEHRIRAEFEVRFRSHVRQHGASTYLAHAIGITVDQAKHRVAFGLRTCKEDQLRRLVDGE